MDNGRKCIILGIIYIVAALLGFYLVFISGLPLEKAIALFIAEMMFVLGIRLFFFSKL